MAFDIPTFRQILSRVQTDMAGFSNGTVPRRSVEFFLARAIAGVSRGLYGFLKYILRQAFADTADETNFWRWFNLFGLERKAAVAWRGTYLFTGTDGAEIPAGSQVQRADGQLYEVDATVEIGADVANEALAVIFAVEASDDGNNPDGQLLSLALPIEDVDSDGEVVSTTTTGADLESPEDALVRLLQHLRSTPRGGGPGDYVRWALEVPGFTRAWEFANYSGPNSVGVAAVRDNDGTGADIIPDGAEEAQLQAYLETVVPITVTPTVITLTPVPLDVTLSDLTPDNAEVRAAIEEALADLLEREAAPGGTLPLSRINEAISGATGEIDHVMTIPSGDVTYTTEEMGVPGTLTVL